MELAMEIRAVTESVREVVGIVAPYDETSFLVPGGERIVRGAFQRSIDHRSTKIPLLDNHKRDLVMGRSTSFAAATSRSACLRATGARQTSS